MAEVAMSDAVEAADTFSGMVAIVTGAASGMGESIAKALAARGATVVLADINVEGGRAVADVIGDAARFVEHDVRQPAQWASLVEDVKVRHGRIDVLVNDAGGGAAFKPLIELTDDEWLDPYLLDVHGTFFGIRAVAPVMQAAGGGSIINIGSTTALKAPPNNSAYASAKAAVAHLTRLAAVELAADKVRVNTVHPGITRTPLSAEQFKDPEFVRTIVDPVPMGRAAEPEDIAAAVLFLASPAARFTTGQEISVDGGHSVKF